MYRARVNSVSGTKVYAGGKWLTCIGNKRVNVGDYIWTDGRCVYGNNHISQQPLIITAPPQAEIGDIPILTLYTPYLLKYFRQYYTFKVKNLGDLGDFLAEFPITYSENDQIMINDDKENTYLLERTIGDSCYRFAANVKNSNIFSLCSTPKPSVQVRKNDEVVTEINCTHCIEETIENCPQPPDWFFPATANEHDVGWRSSFLWGFIEDDDNWAFVIKIKCITSVQACGEEDFYRTDTQQEYRLFRYYYFSSKGVPQLIYNHLWHIDYITGAGNPRGYRLIEDTTITSNLNSIKFPLQDNYYYTSKLKTITYWYNAQSQAIPVPSVDIKYYFEERTIFTPNGKKILTALFMWSHRLIIYKIKNGYLLGVYGNDEGGDNYYTLPDDNERSFFYSRSVSGEGIEYSHDDYIYGTVPYGLPYFTSGIYFINGDQLKTLSLARPLNQRLRPMTKSQNWFQRIQKIRLSTD